MLELLNTNFYLQYIKLFQTFSDVSTTVVLIISLFALIIIYTETSNAIKTYKFLLIAYLCIQMLFGFYFLFFKCVFILPYKFFITVTWLNISFPHMTVICAAFELSIITIIADLLLCMFIERYHFMTKGVKYHSCGSKILIFGGMFLTNILLLVAYINAQIFGGHLFSSEKAETFIYTNFNNTKEIMNLPNLAVSDIFFRVSWATIPLMIFVFLFVFTRTLGYFYFTYKNIVIIKTVQASTNSAMKRHNANAIKILFIQLITLVIFGCIPNTVCIILFIAKVSTFETYIYLECLFHLYFLVDIVMTLLLIRPYRNAIFKYIGGSNKINTFVNQNLTDAHNIRSSL